MNKNSKTVLEAVLCLIKCPICNEEFTNHLKYITCKRNHTFDISNSGYLNLLRKNKEVIYNKELFKARSSITDNGFFDGLEQSILNLIVENHQRNDELTIVDMGCGDGSVFSNILRALEKVGVKYNAIGLDNSKEGISMASRNDKRVLWLVSDIANVPLMDNSVDIILNTLSPANYGEFNRLLKTGGVMIKTVPNKNYLLELRRSANLTDYSNQDVVSLFSENTSNCSMELTSYQKHLSEEEKSFLIKMTPLTQNVSFIDPLPSIVTIDLTILIGKKKTH